MTADWVHLPYEFLAKTSNEIINKVRGINRVVYDISSKPPANNRVGIKKTRLVVGSRQPIEPLLSSGT